jgi:MFS family permease
VNDNATPLFDKPAQEDDAGGGLGNALVVAAFGLAFVVAAITIGMWFDSVAIPEDSFAGGRRSGVRKLIGNIGEGRMQIGLAVVGILILLLAAIEIRGWAKNRDK